MPKVLYKTNALRLNTKKLTREIDRAIQEAMYLAAEDFTQVASSHVPVYTGMARGSFLAKVTPFVGSRSFMPRIANQTKEITPKVQQYTKTGKPRQWPRVNRSYRWWYDELKNKEAGARRSTYRFTKKNTVYAFSFKTSVPHFKFDEETNTDRWGALSAGASVFKMKLNLILAVQLSQAIKRVPKELIEISAIQAR